MREIQTNPFDLIKQHLAAKREKSPVALDLSRIIANVTQSLFYDRIEHDSSGCNKISALRHRPAFP